MSSKRKVCKCRHPVSLSAPPPTRIPPTPFLCLLSISLSASIYISPYVRDCSGAVLLQAAFRGRQARSLFHGHLVLTVLRGIKLANKELLGKMDPVRMFVHFLEC
jgi:hypothetical protein